MNTCTFSGMASEENADMSEAETNSGLRNQAAQCWHPNNNAQLTCAQWMLHPNVDTIMQVKRIMTTHQQWTCHFTCRSSILRTKHGATLYTCFAPKTEPHVTHVSHQKWSPLKNQADRKITKWTTDTESTISLGKAAHLYQSAATQSETESTKSSPPRRRHCLHKGHLSSMSSSNVA